ncbi:MAG: endonuclease [Saprospiraceae bacterium]|nr:endonuclease [Saprospiraceae bacterium]
MLMRLFATISFCVIVWGSLRGQNHEPVFPSLQGDELLEQVITVYKPLSVLPFSQSRDTLFSRVYSHDDSLTCVYTGFTIYLDPALDPTTGAFMNGGPNGLNTEHTYPRGKGADVGNAEADMHHLYATRIDVNATRADLAFGEIPDNETEDWFYQGQMTSNIPSSNIDQYSEVSDDRFEPREDHKGNVARAMFYFYTMYRMQADLADNQYFPEQRADLCQWHALDPVDDAEWTRTHLIAPYQNGKRNPFVLDCTLAERIYCPELAGMVCMPVSTDEPGAAPQFALGQNEPNPFEGITYIPYELYEGGHLRLEVWNATGQLVLLLVNEPQSPGAYRAVLPAWLLQGPGIYRYRLILSHATGTATATKSLLKLK